MSFAPTVQRLPDHYQAESQFQQQVRSNSGQLYAKARVSGQPALMNFDSPNLNTSSRTDRQGVPVAQAQQVPVHVGGSVTASIAQQAPYQSMSWASLAQRLDVMEANLSRVCNQHDALMPLLNLLEYMPQISKNEATVKQLQKRQQDIDSKIQKLDTQVQQTNNQHVFSSIERNFKSTNQTIQRLNGDVRDMRDSMGGLTKVAESKLKEEASHIYKNVDLKLERNKKDIQNLLAEFKNNISLSLKRQEEQNQQNSYNNNNNQLAGGNSQQRFLESVSGAENDAYASGAGAALAQNRPQHFERELHNIYRELGMLRCELEAIYSRERRQHIYQSFQQASEQRPLSEADQNLILHQLEQAVFLEELERFDHDNQERMVFELDQLDKKIAQIREEVPPESRRQETHYAEDKFFSLQNQIHGTKKKYLIEARRIEERMDTLQQLLAHDPRALQDFQDRIDTVNASIVKNVETLQLRQRELDDRIQQLKQQ